MRLNSAIYGVAACVLLVLILPALSVSPVFAGGIAGHGIEWPSAGELFRVLTLRDYNTRVVIVGATLLGLAAGLVGTFLILRKRALLSDTLSHATLPGIALSFMVMATLWGDGKNLPGLILGAALFSVLGTISVLAIQRYSRLKDDAALGIVLSVYFGLGIALMGLATRMESGNSAGLSSFIYGKTASMLFFDAALIAAAAAISALFCILFFKEFTLVCFDEGFAAAQGWPVARLDFFMMALVVTVTVIGLQAVGLILVVSLLIIPPTAARFWTHNLRHMLWLSGFFGALSGLLGSGASALMANLPAGAVIVLSAAVVFGFSLFFGTARGLLLTLRERHRLRSRIVRENLLRELYEWFESAVDKTMAGPSVHDLLLRRSWSRRRLEKTLARLEKQGFIKADPGSNRIYLSNEGRATAKKIVRKHRLWETYLITHADIAPGHVDWGADEIEHVLDDALIEKLERKLRTDAAESMPESPHELVFDKGV